MQDRYLLIDVPIEKNVVREVRFGDRLVRGSASPLDFPDRLRVGWKDHLAFVEFIYVMVPDERTRIASNSEAKVHIGVESGRIFRIEVAIPDSPDAGAIRVWLERTAGKQIDSLESDAASLPKEKRPGRRLIHYEVVPELFPLIAENLVRLRQQLAQ